MLNGCWRICHFGCSHPLHVARAPAPAPYRDSTTSTYIYIYKAGLVRKYVGVDWTTRTPYAKDNEVIYSAYCLTGTCTRMILSLLKYVYASVLLISTTAKCLLIYTQSFPILPCTLQHTQQGSWVFAMHPWASFSVNFFTFPAMCLSSFSSVANCIL